MDILVPNAAEALAKVGLRDGMTITVGGFGFCGIPKNLIAAVRESSVKDFTVISNNTGVDDFGLSLLMETHRINKIVSTYVGENSIFEQQFPQGELGSLGR